MIDYEFALDHSANTWQNLDSDPGQPELTPQLFPAYSNGLLPVKQMHHRFLLSITLDHYYSYKRETSLSSLKESLSRFHL